jgi:uncharacterized phage-associated protein
MIIMKEVRTFNHNFFTSTAAYTYRAYSSSAVSSDAPTYAYVQDLTEQEFTPEDEGKYSVFEVANWFLSKAAITQKKLQKLCYYAQAWCFALKGYKLENTDYEAWIHGPVSPVLWERFKGFGFDPIIYHGNISTSFAPEDLQLLEDVWDTYGNQSGNALEALTHRELPWLEARNGYEPDERCSVVISPLSMASFYKSIYSGD